MANSKLDGLTAATALQDGDLLLTFQGGATKKLTGTQLKTFIGALTTDLQIKTAYENNANTNAFTDSEKTALNTALQ